MADGTTDYTAHGGAAECADSRTLLTRCQRTTSTAGDKQCPYQKHYRQRVSDLYPFHFPLLSACPRQRRLLKASVLPSGLAAMISFARR
jgi:hypothetical protein